MFSAVKSILFSTVKLILFTFVAALLVSIVLILNMRGTLSISQIFTTSEGVNFTQSFLSSLLGELPFVGRLLNGAGFVLNGTDFWNNFYAEGGYGVFHDFIKMLLLFIATHYLFELANSFTAALKSPTASSSAIELLAKAYRVSVDIVLVLYAALLSTILALLLYRLLIGKWMAWFGNGALSNWALFGVIAAVFCAVYFALPLVRRKSLLSGLFDMLLDFGLSAFSLMVAAIIVFVQKYPASAGGYSGGYYASVILPLLFSIAALMFLLHLKLRQKG